MVEWNAIARRNHICMLSVHHVPVACAASLSPFVVFRTRIPLARNGIRTSTTKLNGGMSMHMCCTSINEYSGGRRAGARVRSRPTRAGPYGNARAFQSRRC